MCFKMFILSSIFSILLVRQIRCRCFFFTLHVSAAVLLAFYKSVSNDQWRVTYQLFLLRGMVSLTDVTDLSDWPCPLPLGVLRTAGAWSLEKVVPGGTGETLLHYSWWCYPPVSDFDGLFASFQSMTWLFLLQWIVMADFRFSCSAVSFLVLVNLLVVSFSHSVWCSFVWLKEHLTTV